MEDQSKCRQSRGHRRILYYFTILSSAILLYIGCNQRLSMPSSIPQERHLTKKKILYGHLHMAKTAGTTLNQVMAKLYKNICGNKGFTGKTNFWQIKRRQLFQNTNFETSCDWISSEKPVNFWGQFASSSSSDTEMELHVPCRDPINHLMSIVKHLGKVFDCNAPTIPHHVDSFMTYVTKRFSLRLYRHGNFNIKCFDYRAVPQYVQYMSNHLQALPEDRRTEYIRPMGAFPPVNGRVAEDECIWRDEELMRFVEEYMRNEYHYYEFCDKCIGSEHDLFA